MREAGAREDAFGKRLEGLRRERKGCCRPKLMENRASRGRLQEQIKGLEREQSDFSQLLGRMEDHIRDACCPLCGHDHGSLEVLQEEVEKRRARDAAADLRRRLALLKEAGEELEESLAEVRRNAAVQRKEVEELREEQQAREARIADFEDAVAKVGIPVQEPAVTIREINGRLAQERDNVEEMERTGAALQREVETASATIAELDREIEDGEKAVVETERELDDCRSQIRLLRGDRRAVEVSFDAKAATLREVGDRQMEELANMDVAVSEAAATLKEKTGAANGLRQRVAVVASTLDALRKEIGGRRRTVTETNARLAEFGLAVGAEDREVVHLLEEETKTNSQVAELLDFAEWR